MPCYRKPSTKGRYSTGTYTGDGNATQAITGLAFQPIFLMIWSSSADQEMAIKSDKDANTYGVEPNFPGADYADYIHSFDAGGFTVTNTAILGVSMNALAHTYYFMAWG